MKKKDFKQKYFLYCTNCVTDKIVCNKVAQVRNKPYIRRVIKIEEVDDKKSD